MTDGKANSESLEVTQIISAPPERVFDAWTQPDELRKWWGPSGVYCVAAEIDLQIGGEYRIANQLPDQSVLWIAGEFIVIERPHLLVYTWALEGHDSVAEHVRVAFNEHELGTSVVVTHTRIASPAVREQHEHGWVGCLEGIASHLGA